MATGRSARPLEMDLALLVLDLVVALLFFRRAPVALFTAPRGPLLLGASAVVAAAAAFALVEGPWHPIARVAFVLAALGTALSLASLGRSFTVLPQQRHVVSRGPYQIVRHPAYACELVLLVAVLSAGGPWAWAAGAVAVALQVGRVFIEERMLHADPAYRAYTQRVRHRLLPGVF